MWHQRQLRPSQMRLSWITAPPVLSDLAGRPAPAAMVALAQIVVVTYAAPALAVIAAKEEKSCYRRHRG